MSDLNCNENVIEWLNGDDTVSFTFSQKKYIHRAELLAERYPTECCILKRNSDGSIFGHISIKAIRLNEKGIKNSTQANVSEDEQEAEGNDD